MCMSHIYMLHKQIYFLKSLPGFEHAFTEVYQVHHNQLTVPVVSQVNTIRVQTWDDLKHQVLSQNFGDGVIAHKKVYYT